MASTRMPHALVLVPSVLEAGAVDKTDGCAQAAALAEKF